MSCKCDWMLCRYLCSPEFVKLVAVDAMKVMIGGRGWLMVVAVVLAVGTVAVAVTAMLCR